MNIFTTVNGRVEAGAAVQAFTLSGGGQIAAIIVGEDGRGRKQGVVPVDAPVGGRVMTAGVGQTKAGRPRLVVGGPETDRAIIVAPEGMGFRGGNEFTGDAQTVQFSLDYDARWRVASRRSELAEWLSRHGIDPQATDYEVAHRLEGLRLEAADFGPTGETELERHFGFAPFPGTDLTVGEIAEGQAGRAGHGWQRIFTIPAGVVWRVGYTGRLYGGPNNHYYLFTGETVITATREERELDDTFDAQIHH